MIRCPKCNAICDYDIYKVEEIYVISIACNHCEWNAHAHVHQSEFMEANDEIGNHQG